MTGRTDRAGSRILAWLLSSLTLLVAASADAGFESGIVNLHASTQHIPRVAICSDAAHGAIVFWQEGDTGPLLATRLLASGDPDPAWPLGGTLVAPSGVARSALGATSDAAGGGYVWWLETGVLSVNRVTRDAVTAPGWPAAGRVLGRLQQDEEPWFAPDGSGGVYVGWYGIGLAPNARWRTLAIHLGPNGHGTAGWPDEPLAFEALAENRYDGAPVFALSPGGGLWVAWLSNMYDSVTPSLTATYRVSRVGPSGAPSPGWSRSGTDVVQVTGELPDLYFWGMRPSAIADAGDGGGFLLCWDTASGLSGDPYAAAALHRFTRDGTPAPDWPVAGVSLDGLYYGPSAGMRASPRLYRLPDGRLLTGLASFGVESSEWFRFQHRSPLGVAQGSPLVEYKVWRLKAKFSAAGEFATTWAVPTGWHNVMVGENASFSGRYLSPGKPDASFQELQPGIWTTWYGDSDIEFTGNGAAILVWSQDIDRHGLLAVRLEPDTTIVAPPPVPSDPGLRVRYARGSGVQVAGATGRVTLSLHDLTGRQIAHGESADAGEWTVPGTEDLPSGMYFAKAVADGQEKFAKVVVVR